jgi:Tol biopolymer transport system component
MGKRFAFLSLWVFMAAWVALGCSAGSHDVTFGGNGGASNTTVAATTSGAGGGLATSSTGSCVIDCNTTTGTGGPPGLDIAPKNVSMTATVGKPVKPQAFTATLNGTDVTTQVQWTYEEPQIGSISNNGTFTAVGTVGGTGTLTASIDKMTATTSVSVNLVEVVNTANLSAAQQMQFNSPNGGPDSISIVYPYDNTVFPLGVLAPDMQWNGSAAGDIYRLQLTEKYYSYEEFFTADPPSDHLMSETDWTNFESSGAGANSDPVTVQLNRLSGGKVYQPVSQTLHVAQGRLHGSVYYWELPDQNANPPNCSISQEAGRILKIAPDSTTITQFFPYGGQCYGCHTVSRDGKTLAAEFNEGDGPLYTLDLTQNPVAFGNLNPNHPTGNYIFSAFNNDSTKLMASSNDTQQLSIVDAMAGTTINMNPFQAGPSPNCGEPAWSADGTMIAGICNVTASPWIFDSPTGNLTVAKIDPTGTVVTNINTIVNQSQGNGRPAYPSFSPDGKYLAFGRPTDGSRSTSPGDLWLVSSAGGPPMQLNIATGPMTAFADTGTTGPASFNPVFSPLEAGGYYWLVIVSRRDYGNQLLSTGRNQLWITAIDNPPTSNDPSHPAFYMRGQETCGNSENAYYALDPCAMVGASCVSGVDCCNGTCIVDPTTMMDVCGTPPSPGQCAENGNACKVATDCCNSPSGVQCIDGFCQPPIPM